jgi:hypothetical protein
VLDLLLRDASFAWDMFDVPDNQTDLDLGYSSWPDLPGANEFLLFASPNETSPASPQPDVSRLVENAELPAELAGVPVFLEKGERVVFVAHVLQRVLECQCRANRHFGLFKDKKHVEFRRTVDASSWRFQTHYSDSYEHHRENYSLLRLRDSAAAITLEGLFKWANSKMATFKRKEAAKCAISCVEGKCTCEKK